MLNIAICDDEPVIAHQIESFLLDIQKSHSIKIDILDVFYHSSELANSLSLEKSYDIIYLDIEMPQKNGIELAQLIREKNFNSLLIYVSGYEQYFKQLFEVETFRFIKKPINKEIFDKYFFEALEKAEKNNIFFDFKYKHSFYKIPINNIVYFESQGRYIIIHLSDNTTCNLRSKLHVIEIQIYKLSIPFLRIHQSYLINYNYILCMSRSQVKLIDNIILPISYEKQKSIRIQYTTLLGEINDK